MKKSMHSTRRSFVKQLGAAGAAGILLSQSTLSARAADIEEEEEEEYHHRHGEGISIVLVHGAYADASSWNIVTLMLQKCGYKVLAVQNPLSSLEDDVKVTRQALKFVKGPKILVGHSYGGAVITNAGRDIPDLLGLVYIAAFAPDEGESILDIAARFSTPPLNQYLKPSYREGYDWIEPEDFPANFIQDIPAKLAMVLATVQKPITQECFTAKTGEPAWKQVPSWYLVSANDRAINPEAERYMAKRIGATTREIDASHVPMVSRPHEVARIIKAAAHAKTAIGKG